MSGRLPVDIAGRIAGRVLAAPSLAVPNPGSGVAPPGAVKLVLLLQWGAWLVTTAAVAGIFIVAGTMVLRHRRGDGGAEAASGLMWVLFGCVLIGSASAVVGAITG